MVHWSIVHMNHQYLCLNQVSLCVWLLIGVALVTSATCWLHHCCISSVVMSLVFDVIWVSNFCQGCLALLYSILSVYRYKRNCSPDVVGTSTFKDSGHLFIDNFYLKRSFVCQVHVHIVTILWTTNQGENILTTDPISTGSCVADSEEK